MSNAIGGTVNIVIISIFMVIVAAYMAFNISYVKAFKVKNKIIDLVEQYEGDCLNSGSCQTKIENYMDKIGYNTATTVPRNFCGSGTCSCNTRKGYCISEVVVQTAKKGKKGNPDRDKKAYYKVMTQVNIDIPILKNIMPHINVFQVTGETKTITAKN